MIEEFFRTIARIGALGQTFAEREGERAKVAVPFIALAAHPRCLEADFSDSFLPPVRSPQPEHCKIFETRPANHFD